MELRMEHCLEVMAQLDLDEFAAGDDVVDDVAIVVDELDAVDLLPMQLALIEAEVVYSQSCLLVVLHAFQLRV